MTNAIDILVNYVTKGDEKTLNSMADLAKAMGYVGAAVGAAKAIYEATVGPTIEYAKQIENLNTVTQTGAAETSKLIQVADDARIEFGVLQVAAKNMVKNGIQPTIDNMASLSDEYLDIQDPVERTQFLMETFGSKAGPEMEKLLKLGSDALYEMADGAEAVGLVMDEQALQAAKDYQASLDNLSDTVQGAQIQIGTKLVPALDNALKGTMAAAGGYMMMVGAITSAINPFDDAAKAAEAKAKADQAAADAAAAAEVAERNHRIEVEAATPYMSDYGDTTDIVNGYIEEYARKHEEAKQKTQELFDSINTNLDSTIENWLRDLEWMQSGGLLLQQQFDAIKKAFVENPDDPDIKRQMLELYAQTEALNVEIGKIDATQAAENIASTLGVSINDAWMMLDRFKADLANGASLTVDVQFDDHGGYQGSGVKQAGDQGDDDQTGKTPYAFGGAVFAGGDYWVGEQGPEPFSPAQPGTITPTSTVINNYNLSMQTQQSTGNLIRDFGVMQAFRRA